MKDCCRFYERQRLAFDGRILLTGHSLGGNRARLVGVKYDAPYTVTYNSAADDYLGLPFRLRPQNVKRLYQHYAPRIQFLLESNNFDFEAWKASTPRKSPGIRPLTVTAMRNIPGKLSISLPKLTSSPSSAGRPSSRATSWGKT